MVCVRCCFIGAALIIKKLEFFQGHCKIQCFVSAEYRVLGKAHVSSNLSVLFKDNSLKVLFHMCGINNKEVWMHVWAPCKQVYTDTNIAFFVIQQLKLLVCHVMPTSYSDQSTSRKIKTKHYFLYSALLLGFKKMTQFQMTFTFSSAITTKTKICA